MKSSPRYLTWIRKKKTIILLFVAILMLVIGTMLTILPQFLSFRLSWVLYICAAVFYVFFMLFLSIFIILMRISYLFSDKGGQFQSKIHEIICNKITKEFKTLLDIGCGSGSLLTKIGKNNHQSNLIGVDYYGGEWGQYSKTLCQQNILNENLTNIEILQSSASHLPFKDESFDVIVSCLTFHEVKDEANKNKVINESLRVLKKNGQFIFIDLFMNKKIFSNFEEVLSNLKSSTSCTETIPLKQLIILPKVLLIKQALKDAVLISGIK